MTETEQQEQRQKESPLHSERGTTKISDTIVSQIIDIAVNDIEGIRPGRTNSQVGEYEVAVDFNMEMQYGRDLPALTSAIRTRISEEVRRMTGLQVIEQNVTVTDVFFSDGEDDKDGEDVQRDAIEEREEESREETMGGAEQETEEEGDEQETATSETERETDQSIEQEIDREIERETEEETERELDRESEVETDSGSDSGSDREVLLDTERDDEEEVVWDPKGETEGGEGGDEPRNRNR